MPDAIAIIPARYGSTRFPGKPLAIVNGVMMVKRVYRSAREALGRAVVATDDERIFDAVRGFGGEAVMTSPSCQNGTARVAEAYRLLGCSESIVVNVQGDEPYVLPQQIKDVAGVLERVPEADISTLALKFDPCEGFESLFDPNRVKMVRDRDGRALYFSRSIVPYVRDVPWQQWIEAATFIYTWGCMVFVEMCSAGLSICRRRLSTRPRILNNCDGCMRGYRIYTAETSVRTYPVDTPQDLEKAEERARTETEI